jgi:hypothetical protein
MTCDDGIYTFLLVFLTKPFLDLTLCIFANLLLGRPCQRCIKRSIGHLCHDEPKGSHGVQQMSGGHNALPANILTMQSLPQEGKILCC